MEENKKPTMKNIQAYLTTFMTKRCQDLFKEYLPPNYVPLVQKNSIGDSEFTSPCATQIFNICNKKPNFKFTSIEQVAEEIIKDLKDEAGIISEFKIVVQEPVKKDDKKKKEKEEKKDENKEGKKKEKRKTNSQKYLYRYIFKYIMGRNRSSKYFTKWNHTRFTVY